MDIKASFDVRTRFQISAPIEYRHEDNWPCSNFDLHSSDCFVVEDNLLNIPFMLLRNGMARSPDFNSDGHPIRFLCVESNRTAVCDIVELDRWQPSKSMGRKTGRS